MNQLVDARALVGEVIAPGEGVDVYVRPSPLRQDREHLHFPAGMSLQEIAAECRSTLHMRSGFPLYIEIAGEPIPADWWPRIRMKPGAVVKIIAVPGKSFGRSILSIVISIAALFIAPIIAGPIINVLGVAATGAAASAITGVIGAGISAGATMVLGALFGQSGSSVPGEIDDWMKSAKLLPDAS